jgi:hypothetical protein
MEQHLPGGFVTTVVRAGDTVPRRPSPNAASVHDLAHVCWQFLDLGPATPDLREAARRLRLLCDNYGLEDRTRLVETILWWQDRCWRGIELRAAAGDPAMTRLRARGAAADVRAAHAWVAAHRTELENALT